MAYGYRLRQQRYGSMYRQELEFLRSSDKQSKEVLKTIQEERLKMLLTHAIQHVPHYRELAKSKRFGPQDVNIENIAEFFPILDTREVRSNPERFASEAFSRREVLVASTSGTSGSPLRVVRSRSAIEKNYAFFARFLEWHGISPFSRSATFAGRTLVSADRNKPPFWRRNPAMNNVQFSSYHISLDTIASYIDMLNQFQPEFIDAYPSAIYALAKAMVTSGTRLKTPPTLIMTSSETLLPTQRMIIEEAFQCPVRDQYGAVEMAFFAGQCEHGNYHFAQEYGIVEFVPESKPSGEAMASVVATGFLNLAMPLIRYKIGDLVDDHTACSCQCGRNSTTVKSIMGRLDDVILTPDGREIGRLSPVFKEAPEILECQVIQTELDYITLRAVPIPGSSPDAAAPIVRALQSRLPANMRISVELVDRLDRGANGKLRTVVRKMP